jgi:hypothetical protein
MPAKDASNITWAIVLPQDALAQGAEGSTYTNGYIGKRPEIAAIARNTYYGDGIDMDLTTHDDSKVKDLKDVDVNWEAEDGWILTGTLNGNYKITIADGATVLLNGVTINGTNNSSYAWAGLNCNGDATIILKDGTTNTVKGFYEDYPGIHVPSGSTLIIKGETSGTGELYASSNDDTNNSGAGIGGGWNLACGNIEIQGGVINATGSTCAAGIGSNNQACGNITISGGTVTATGGGNAAGIGGGFGGGCGDITIASTVTRVTATKGIGADHSIGRGRTGSIGTVTIGGDAGSVSTSPYIYAPLTWGSGFISSISLDGSGNVSQGGIKASLSGIADKDQFTSSNIDLESGTLTFEIESGGAYASYSIKKIEIYYDGPLGSISGTPSDGWSVNTSEKIVTWSGTSTTVSLRSANPASEWLYIGDIPHIVFHLHK